MKTLVDLWLHFGAFAYGIEGELVQATESSITFAVCSHPQGPTTTELNEWIKSLNAYSHVLVHCEIRVFDPNNFLKKAVFFSNQLPEVSSTNPLHCVLNQLRPQTPDDTQNIKIFPTNSSAPTPKHPTQKEL